MPPPSVLLPNRLQFPHGPVNLPVFLPDATQGFVRALDSQDLRLCQIEAVVMNTFHLMQRPGSSTVRSLGGLHKMAGWPYPIVTDSGGFQAYSIIQSNPKNGSLSDKGIIFRPEGTTDKLVLTPEKTVQLQVSYGSDVVICLDDCTHPDAPLETQETSVRRTIAWAKRCKAEFARLMEDKKLPAEQLPQIFAVIQGGRSPDLRRQCAEELLKIGFDGFGYGGWPLDGQGNLLIDMFHLLRELIPASFPLHALGVGHPENIAACYRAGWTIFDSAFPTRDARHGRVFAFSEDALSAGARLDGKWFHFIYVEDKKHIKADTPIFPGCDCHCCTHYSLGYLHHLYKIGDPLYARLATMHNLRFMTRLCQRLVEL